MDVANNVSYASGHGGRRNPSARTSSNQWANGDRCENVPPPRTRVSAEQGGLGEIRHRLLGRGSRRESRPVVAAFDGPQRAFVRLHGDPMVELGA